MNRECVAWWYLMSPSSFYHLYVAVFVDNECRMSVSLAEGKSGCWALNKDEDITKPTWVFSVGTCRDTLARVLKYAHAVVGRRIEKGWSPRFISYEETTGTPNCALMRMWESMYTAIGQSPAWWPLWHRCRALKSEARLALDDEGFHLQALLTDLSERRYARRQRVKQTMRRVGRFTVFNKVVKQP